MGWELALLILMGGLAVLLVTGMPVAFCFLLLNIVFAFIFLGGDHGLMQLSLSYYSSIATFNLLPLPLFILMGEVMFHSGVAPLMIDALDKWLGRLPGRLALEAVGAGTIIAALTGASMGSVAILGSTLLPEMEKRGYKRSMSIGPILGSGGLAIMIPPSGLAVLLGAIGEISIGKILIAIPIPGLLMAATYAAYIIGRCYLQPSIAPAYHVPDLSLKAKLIATVFYILPLGIVIFLVTGVIVAGIATPTEAAASGALGTFIVAALYRRLNWSVMKRALTGSLKITVMMFMIIIGAMAFGQTLAYSGASQGLIGVVTNLPLPPIFIFMIMQIVLLFLGCFIDVVSIMMITVPLFMPIIHALKFDPVWFAVIVLINMEMAGVSPPFGMSLFVMKAIAPPDCTMEEIYKAGLPFLGCNLVSMVLIMIFPAIALWLPNLFI